MKESLFALAGRLLVERPAQQRRLPDIIEHFHNSAADIDQRIAGAANTPANRELLRHIIGIERWGQRRLRVALGETPIHDEYDAYRPDEDLDIAGLRRAFTETRQATINLAHEFEARPAALDEAVRHNDFGGITARAWLVYLNMHANIEIKRLRT
jgi:hypothetical protein